jgi:hypothetical protein
MHGSIVTSFQRQATVLNGSGQTGHGSEISGLRTKDEYNMASFDYRFSANLLTFSTPTHTHDFADHRNGYGRSNTTLVCSVKGWPEIQFVNRF